MGAFEIPHTDRAIAARLDAPSTPRGLFLFAHGAGAGMDHAFMAALTERLVARGGAVLRYQFPYMQQGKWRPDRPAILEGVVRAVADWCLAHESDLPEGRWLAGGKSMGGRITARVAATGALPERFNRLAFVGFPLHAARKPKTDRAETLRAVRRPMLFLQGDRDALAGQRQVSPAD